MSGLEANGGGGNSTSRGGGHGGGRGGRGRGGRGRGGGRGGRGRGRGGGRGGGQEEDAEQEGQRVDQGEEKEEVLSMEDGDDDYEDDDGNSGGSRCLICFKSDLARHRGILPCGHNDICAPCHLRLRHLHSDKRCPVCKTTNDRMIVDDTREEAKLFEEYNMWGDEIGPNHTFRNDVGVFFRKDYYNDEVLPLFSLRCGIEGCDFVNESDSYVTKSNADMNNSSDEQQLQDFLQDDDGAGEDGNNNRRRCVPVTTTRMSGLKALNEHLRSKHRLALCQLCVTAKRDFVSRLPRFNPSELKQHLTKGDGPGSGFEGHPVCEFCRPRRFYDLTQLYDHLRKEHFKCHVCERLGRDNQFFKNYHSLAIHFDRQHFLCNDAQCLAARFVVFENEIDLRAHQRDVHGIIGTGTGRQTGSTKIQLEFRVRRSGFGGEGYEGGQQDVPSEEDFQYGLNGEAFVPADLPQPRGNNEMTTLSEEGDTHDLDSFHVARTAELRAQAAQRRQELGLNFGEEDAQGVVEAFPSLQGEGPSESSAPLRVGWSSRITAATATPTAEEAFPTLQSTNRSNKRSVAAHARRRIAPDAAVNSQFAAMRLAASGGGGATSSAGGSWASSAAATGVLHATPSATPAVASSSSSLRSPAVTAPTANRQADLSAENFPSLAPAPTAKKTVVRRTAAASSTAAAAPPSFASMTDFPAPPPSSVKAPPRAGKKAAAPPPKVDNMLDFPAPSSSMSSSTSATPVDGKALVEEMKVTMGTARYKKLKGLTKEFVAGSLSPKEYVDSALEQVFDGGNNDDFWRFVPALIRSCPNEKDNAKALQYMDSLRRNFAAAAPAPTQQQRPAAASSGWAAAAGMGGPPPPPTGVAPPPPPGMGGANRRAVTVPTSSTSIMTSTGVSGYSGMAAGGASVRPKGKNAWGAGSAGVAAVGRGGAKASHSTAHTAAGAMIAVAAAAESQQVQVGTATKGMAKIRAEQAKKKQAAEQAATAKTTNTQKQKKKAKNELKALAYGGN